MKLCKTFVFMLDCLGNKRSALEMFEEQERKICIGSGEEHE